MTVQAIERNNFQTLQRLTGSFVDEESHAFKSFVKWANLARSKQIAPKGDWSVWLILAGR